MKDILEDKKKPGPVIVHVCVDFHSVPRWHCQWVLLTQLNIQKEMSDMLSSASAM